MSNKFQEVTQDIQARINEVAYLMWESAGRQQGMAMEYWLKAESEVMATLQSAASRMMPSSRKGEEKPAAPAKSVVQAGPAAAPKPSIEAPKEAKPAVAAAKPAAEAKPVAAVAPPSPARKPAARGKSKS